MKDRLVSLRKTLSLSQQEFADKLNIKRGTIANYECGRNEPIDAVINLICREFSVNENWLRTGEGEMFLPIERENDIARLTMQLLTEESDSFKNRLISALSRLSVEEWEVIEKTFEAVVNAKKE